LTGGKTKELPSIGIFFKGKNKTKDSAQVTALQKSLQGRKKGNRMDGKE